MDSRVSAHGFTKSEVEQIKAAIDAGKSQGHNSTVNVIHRESSEPRSGSGFLKGLMDNDNSNQSNEKDFWEQRRERIEGKVNEISEINITGTADEISQQMTKLFSLASSKPNSKVKSAIIEKIEFGAMRLRSLGANAEADFFEKKLEPLKKKGLFGF